jgi:hypothetical protein
VFATYSKNPLENTDALIVKENVHMIDGSVVPNIRILPNREWPFYITKEGFRNHKDKKEWEDINKLQKFKSTRLHLNKKIARALNMGVELPLRKLANSPYLYGADALPTVLIKKQYQKQWQDCKTESYNVAALDTETSMVDGSIIMANICYKNLSYTAIVRKWTDNDPNIIEKTRKRAQELMGEDLAKRNLQWDIELVDSPGEAVYKTIQRAHQWKPDFISIWNMNFDIPKMVEALERENYDLAQVFSDPSVPEKYRFFSYREGPAIKITQDGSKMSLHPAERWHVCTCPASFYFLDSMCLYKRIRVASGNESSYSLNWILLRNKLDSKLKIKETEQYEEDGDVWHTVMQDDFKPEYIVYNLRDDLALIDLDNKTGDIARAFPILAGLSDYGNYSKGPRKISDDLHFFVMDRGKIIATTPEDISADPLNRYLLNLNSWIITLPSYMIKEGMNLFEDAPDVKTMIYRYLADLDVTSTYPTGELVLNISKETTLFETGMIKGFTEAQRRELGIVLTSGRSAALELNIKFFGMPSPQQLVEQYRKDHAIIVDQAA